MTNKRLSLVLALFLAVSVGGGCLGAGARPEPFTNPLESRLILQVPFYSDEAGACGPSALASVMTYCGRPTTTEEAVQALNQEAPSAQSMAVWARREGLMADVFSGSPERLLEAVKMHKPIIVRLDRETQPLRKGDYAVVVGYTPDGPVLNSCDINQQIVPWTAFLAGWYRSSNLSIMIEPM
jgi:hypothetical protein